MVKIPRAITILGFICLVPACCPFLGSPGRCSSHRANAFQQNSPFREDFAVRDIAYDSRSQASSNLVAVILGGRPVSLWLRLDMDKLRITAETKYLTDVEHPPILPLKITVDNLLGERVTGFGISNGLGGFTDYTLFEFKRPKNANLLLTISYGSNLVSVNYKL